MLNLFHKSKPEPEDVAKFVREHAAQINGSLCVFGDWFGRPMDNWHKLVSHEAKEGYIRLAFDEGETLEVWDAAGARMEGKSFIIQRASRVRWEWFYYGRPKLPENRFFIEHVVSGESIDASSDADWAPRVFKPSRAEPAVSIT
jgi:hypothetical protein